MQRKLSRWSALNVVVAALILLASSAIADPACESPQSFDMNSVRGRAEWANWCVSCGGTVNDNARSCDRGPNWKGGDGSGAVSYGNGSTDWRVSLFSEVGVPLIRDAVQSFFHTDPAQEAARLTRIRQLEEEALERQRQAAQMKQQKMEETHRRLLPQMKEMSPTLAPLGLKLGKDAEPPPAARTPLPKFDCPKTQLSLNRMETEVLKTMDDQITRLRELSRASSDEMRNVLLEKGQELLEDYALNQVKDFMTSRKAIDKMRSQLGLLKGKLERLRPSQVRRLEIWLKMGLDGTERVLTAHETSKELKFADPVEGKSRAVQMLKAVEEFNEQFLNENDAWELAGEHLSKALGPAGPFAFKTAVLGIEVTSTIGDALIHRGVAQKVARHAEAVERAKVNVVHKIWELKRQLRNHCEGKAGAA